MNPTIEPTRQESFPSGTDPAISPKKMDEREIVSTLQSYMAEGKEARLSGPNGRDDVWKINTDLYWNRIDFSKKAKWQAKEVLPEVPGFVDRFAAALKDALVASPEGFYTVKDPADKENDIGQGIKRLMDVWLSTSAMNQSGIPLHFSAFFEEQMKLGAMMATCGVVTWKEDFGDGRVATETVDPRTVWFDPTMRNLYRVRRIEVDKKDLYKFANEKDNKGRPLFNLPEVQNLVSHIAIDEQARREELSGHGASVSTSRAPILIDEYIATIVDNDGTMVGDRALFVVANEKFLIRGPEANPFWHGKDWLVYSPLVPVPLSVYGRSYMEDFGSLAMTFTEVTNMIIDAVQTSSLRNFAMVPSMLLDPSQINTGLAPNKLWFLDEGYRAEDFAKALELGQLPPDVIKIWEALKSELTEAGKINEIGLGQFAPNSRTSATEITETKQSSSALIRSISQTTEIRFLDVILDNAWKTGLQHMKPNDALLREAAGSELYDMFIKQRKQMIKRPITFQARGISQLIQRSSMLKTLISILQVIASNEILLKEFMAKIDPAKLVGKLLELSGVDITTLQMGEREKLIRSVTEPMNAQAQGAGPQQQPAQPGMDQMKSLIGNLNIGNGAK